MKHSLERTSPKGQAFVGTCVLCGLTGLPMIAEAERTAGYSVRMVEGAMSIVRENLLTQPGYTPYCGAEKCTLRMPRTHFVGGQFACGCGWKSSFEAEFIDQYKAAQASLTVSRTDGASTAKSAGGER